MTNADDLDPWQDAVDAETAAIWAARDVPPHLANVHLGEFTENIPRRRSTISDTGVCGALPARALAMSHPLGCLMNEGHTGPHAADHATAARLQRRIKRA